MRVLNLLLIFLLSFQVEAQTLKVFILAGQSNAEGQGDIGPLDTQGTLLHFMDNGGSTEFDFTQDDNGDWVERDDVWIRYDKEFDGLATGNLNVGFGANDLQIGPEFGMGHQLGQNSQDKVLIIKTCWGGKSLAVDFRPPSSGGTVGSYYNQMISDINAAINNIATEFPDYNNETIEIAGFTWFQGWNDGDNQAFLDEYEQNLINLIGDVRSDLNIPDLPFVIGLTGNGGLEIDFNDTWVNGLQTQLVPAQIAAANYEGHINVDYVDTRPFWRDGSVSPESDFGFHWNNNGESFLRIGDGFGKKMNELLAQANFIPTQSMGSIQASTNT